MTGKGKRPRFRWCFRIRRHTSAKLTVVVMMIVMLTIFRKVLLFGLCDNLASVILNKALWQENQLAADRQQSLALAASLWSVAAGEGYRYPEETGEQKQGECSMIPAMVIADDCRKKKDLVQAATWLRRAATADPYPTIQSGIVLPSWTSATPRGNIVLDWSTANWYFRHDSQPADLAFDDENGWLNISYHNKLGQRDTVIYTWSGPLEIPYWHTLYLRAKVYPGTFLTFSTHSVDGVERHVDYHRGTGEWEEFTILLDADSIKWIYVSLSEPSSDPDTSDYAIDIEPLIFLLDAAAGKCEP